MWVVFYDADGRRVRKTLGGASVDYLYDLSDHQIAEVNSSGGWNRGEVYAGDRHLATYNNGATFFMHSDWLGTERARSNISGVVCETISSLPFGDGQTTSGSCSDISPMHFTGQQRDAESGLDYFGARFDASSMGRFTSPDPGNAGASPDNPQSWNAYAYVLDNPLTNVDPIGLDCIHINVDTGVFEGLDRGDCDNSTEEKANSGQYVDGTITGLESTTGDSQGVVTGYTGINKDSGSLISGLFSSPLDSPTDNGLTPFANAVFGQVVNNILGPPAYRVCKAQVSSGFNNNWFIKNFSLGSLGRDPGPFVKTTEEAVVTKGTVTALAYGGGGALQSLGRANMRMTGIAGSAEPEYMIGRGIFKAGTSLKGNALFGVKVLGTVGTVATAGASVADFADSQRASYQCRAYF